MKFKNTRSLLFLLVFVVSCGGGRELMDTQLPDAAESAPDRVDYTLLFLIHGDGDYLYHDRDGNSRQADQQVLRKALKVGRESIQGEVFIFHQRPRKKMLGLFPSASQRVWVFRGGEEVYSGRYHGSEQYGHSPDSSVPSSDSGPSEDAPGLLDAESEFYHRLRSASSRINVALFFGHEIPRSGGSGYHRSRPEVVVNVKTFSEGLRAFLQKEDPFDLMVLSTCNNGSPEMVQAVRPLTNFLLASPHNLHLSHMNVSPLHLLESDRPVAADRLGEAIAHATFERLRQFLQTEITLSMYDTAQLDPAVLQQESLSSAAGDRRKEKRFAGENRLRGENHDCADLEWSKGIPFSEGVKSWYQPPRFGSNAGKEDHSGWGCIRER